VSHDSFVCHPPLCYSALNVSCYDYFKKACIYILYVLGPTTLSFVCHNPFNIYVSQRYANMHHNAHVTHDSAISGTFNITCMSISKRYAHMHYDSYYSMFHGCFVCVSRPWILRHSAWSIFRLWVLRKGMHTCIISLNAVCHTARSYVFHIMHCHFIWHIFFLQWESRDTYERLVWCMSLTRPTIWEMSLPETLEISGSTHYNSQVSHSYVSHDSDMHHTSLGSHTNITGSQGGADRHGWWTDGLCMGLGWTWLIHMCDDSFNLWHMTHSYVWNASFIEGQMYFFWNQVCDACTDSCIEGQMYFFWNQVCDACTDSFRSPISD